MQAAILSGKISGV